MNRWEGWQIHSHQAAPTTHPARPRVELVGGTPLAELNSAGIRDRDEQRGSATPTEGPGTGVQLRRQLVLLTAGVIDRWYYWSAGHGRLIGLINMLCGCRNAT